MKVRGAPDIFFPSQEMDTYYYSKCKKGEGRIKNNKIGYLQQFSCHIRVLNYLYRYPATKLYQYLNTL